MASVMMVCRAGIVENGVLVFFADARCDRISQHMRSCREQAAQIVSPSMSKFQRTEDFMMITTAHLSPALALIFGVLILMFPRILNYLVAIYLILSGLLGLGILAIR